MPLNNNFYKTLAFNGNLKHQGISQGRQKSIWSSSTLWQNWSIAKNCWHTAKEIQQITIDDYPAGSVIQSAGS